jgi:hyperosmotically inducible periplasmic protein
MTNMKLQTRILKPVSAIALAVMAGSALAATSMTQDVVEARQETQIWTTYALSPYLRANDLKVTVDAGKATLSGMVDEDVNRDLAQQIALGVDGVTEVDNLIKVQSDYVPPPQSSGNQYAARIDDATITAAVKSKLAWSTHTEALTTKVETAGGKVTLAGTADSKAAKTAAGALAANTRGVTAVDNQLTVGAPQASMAQEAGSKVGTAEREIADTWITTKVKSIFLYSSHVDGSDIGVETGAGIVTLTGKVDSGVERALVIELAKNVRGVKRVESEGLVL